MKYGEDMPLFPPISEAYGSLTVFAEGFISSSSSFGNRMLELLIHSVLTDLLKTVM